MKKAIYFIFRILGLIVAFGAGIGVAVSSKVFARFKDIEPFKESIKKADEVLEELAKDKLSEEFEEVSDED